MFNVSRKKKAIEMLKSEASKKQIGTLITEIYEVSAQITQ